MSKLRILFTIPCLALSLTLVGCGEAESTFTPIESTEPMGTDSDYETGTEPGSSGSDSEPDGSGSDTEGEGEADPVEGEGS